MLKDVFGLIYAGEQNLMLRELVMLRSVAAMPIGGRYRAIDFQLSNMVNTGIRNIGVITQKNYNSLMDHLGSGKEWDLSRKTGGLFMLPPFDTQENTGVIRGINEAIKGAFDYVRRAPQQYCLLSGSYTVYTTTYDDMLKFHIDNNADITMLYNVEPDNIYGSERFKDVRITLDDDGRVNDIEFNSHVSKSNKLGMDVYIIRKSLLEYLVDDACAHGKYNFVSDVLMHNLKSLRIFAMEHKGYVGRLHSVSSYFNLNMDMLKPNVQQELFYTGNPVYTKIKDEAPVRYMESAKVKNSIIANGCEVHGEVEDCVLFRGVYVGKNSKLKGCIVMQDSEIHQNCELSGVIIDKNANVREGKRLVSDPSFPVIIRKGAVV